MPPKLFLAAFSTLVMFGLVGFAAQDEEPEYTISEVMKEAHKGGLLKKVFEGKASDEDKAKLLDLYEAMLANDPPKGSAEAWKKRSEAIVAAAKELIEDKEGASEKLTKAVNCKACHSEHRP